jgi:1,2-phenylacetyl-CoA epoxidase catalytic subunit
MNGRSLPDFAAMLGMCAANYGHTRALYQLIALHGESYAKLERERGPDEICSMELLDEAPRSWEDFIACIWLAELATWTLASRYLHHADRTLAGLARKIGQEAYFHLKYANGWLRVFADSPDCTEAFRTHFARRRPLAVRWLGREEGDAALAAGEAALDVQSLRGAFDAEIARSFDALGWADEPVKAQFGRDWRDAARRHGSLPDALFEVIRFKHPELAH